jgi:trimeric autotransporter adhesin
MKSRLLPHLLGFLLLFTIHIAYAGSGTAAKKLVYATAKASPVFVNGSSQSLSICENSTSVSLDSYLATTDTDLGQVLTWSIVKAPANGIVHGFPGIGSSNGGTVTPVGFGFTPSSGFSGSDQFIVSVSDGTASVQTTINVTVNPTVSIAAITGKTATCLGTSTVLSNATPDGVWTSSNTSVATIAADGTVTAVAAGTTTISYIVTNASGCSSVTTISFTVSGYPFVPANTGTNTVCAGATTQLSNTTTSGVWTSANTATATVSSTGLVTGVAGTVGGTQVIITYTVTNATGCSTARNTNVTVYAAPTTPTINATTTSGCVNTTLQLTGSGTGGGGTATWASSNTSVATVSNAGLVTGISAGTASITYTISNFRGCTSAAKQDVTFGNRPVVDAISGVSSICLGNTVQLTNATPNGTWRSGNTNIATVNANGLVTPITAGTVTLFYTVTSSGCATSTNFNLLINDKPAIGTIVGTNTTCVGTATTLSNTTAGGVWSSSNTAIATVSSGGVVTGIGVGTDTIYYTVTNAAGCSQTVFVPFTVANGISVAPITGNKTICVGNNTTLNTTTTGGAWSTSDASIASISTGGVVTGVAAGKVTITYAVSGGTGCSGSATAEITVLTSPVLSAINGTTSVCVGQTSQLTNSVSGGLWISSNNGVASVSSTGLVTAIAGGNTQITYSVTNAGGCSQSVTAIVTVNNLPAAGRIIGTNSICTATSVTYTNNALGGIWSSSNTNIATINATGTATGVGSGSTEIRYTVTNGNGCSAFSALTLDVNPTLVVDTIIGSKNVCLGAGNVTYRDSTTGGTWTSSNTAAAVINAASGVLTPVAQGSTIITYLVNNGTCSGSASITVTVNARPAVPTISPNNGATVCAGATTTFTGAPSGGYWVSSSLTSVTIDSTTGVAYGVRGNTQANISYTVTNAAGCIRNATTQLTVQSSPGLQGITGTNTVCVKSTTQFTNNTTGGVWTSSNNAVATVNSSTGLITGVSSGTSIITYAVSNGGTCPQSVFRNVTVNALPTVSAIGGTASICVGANSVLTNTTANGVWSTNNSAVSSVTNLGVLSGISAGNDSVFYTVTNNNNCVNKAGALVTINALPVVGAITGTTSICVGKTSQLSNATSGGVWSSSNTSVATVGNSTGLLIGLSAGIVEIKYIVTNASGCVDSVSTSVTINALPTIASITGSGSICVGKSLQLRNATNGGSWVSANTTIATVNSISGVVTGKSAGIATIRYVVTNASGCVDSVSTSVTVNALPIIGAITGTNTICIGKTTTLSSTTSGGVVSNSDASVASWVNGGSNSILVTGLKAGTTKFTYVVTNASGCVDSVSTTVTVNALPVVGAISGATTICAGKFSQLGNSAAGGIWSSSNTSVASVSSTGLLSGLVLEHR